MPCRYIISTGAFLNPQGQLLGTCYSGHPPFVNDPKAIGMRNRGPLPPGPYCMAKPINTAPDSTAWTQATAHLGPLAIPLVPLPVNGKYDWLEGRSGFFIHGDAVAHPGFGSEGCIVPTELPDGQMDGRAIRIQIAAIRDVDQFLNVQLTQGANNMLVQQLKKG